MSRGRGRWCTLWGAALALVIASSSWAQVAPPQVQLDGKDLPKFADPLPVLSLDPAVPGIQVALGTRDSTDPLFPNGLQEMTLSMCEFRTQVLPTGAAVAGDGKTSVWGYRIGGCPPTKETLVQDSYIGPVVVAERHVPTRITFRNRLGDSSETNVLAYKYSTDLTLMWADPLSFVEGPTGLLEPTLSDTEPLGFLDPHQPWDFDLVPPPEENMCAHNAVAGVMPMEICNDNYYGPIPAAPHLHGGEVPAVLDGGPDAWWTETGIYGHGYYSLNGFDDSKLGQAIYTYPNTQQAAPIWFHDHVLGATRLNVYAGIAGAYMITETDPGETVLDHSSTLAAGLLPLGLDTDGNSAMYQTNLDGTPILDADGNLIIQTDELLVPIVLQDRAFDTNGELYFHGAGFNSSITHPFWVPEFVGDTIAVNGKVWPYLDVAPKRYRFLFLNGSNARAYELRLIVQAAGKKIKNPKMWVIGNDQGYLDLPVAINSNNNQLGSNLTIMPGERYEVIIDFAGYAGLEILMTNTAAIPYPFGAPVMADLDDTVMKFKVGPATPGFVDMSYDPNLGPVSTRPMTRLVDAATGTVNRAQTVHKVRQLTLNEAFDPVTLAPVALFMNNTTYIGEGNLAGVDAPRWGEFADVTTRWNTSYYSELPIEGETEVWEIINFSADAHPIHPHLVAFQILNREPFDALAYQAAYDAAFPARPDPNNPGGVLVGFDPGAGPPYNYNNSNGTRNPYMPGAKTANCGTVPPGAGQYDCVLGGNPDPNDFLLPGTFPIPPLPAEQGWKDTAISYPGEILRLLIRFAPPEVAADTPSTSPLAAYEFSPAEGHGYVWHCHIIDHEDNEMMRPYNVTPNPSAPAWNARTVVHNVHY